MICILSWLLVISAAVLVDSQNFTKSGFRFQFNLKTDRRQLPESIGLHQPYVTVTDAAAIDLDQAAIEDELDKASDNSFQKAKLIYEQGGHSKSYAEIFLDDNLDAIVANGTFFEGNDCSGSIVIGRLFAREGNMLKLRYESMDGLEGVYSGCQVGALPMIDKQQTDDCFSEGGVLEAMISGQLEEFSYTYNMLTNNKNERTIKSFSTLVRQDMLDCAKCPYPDVKYAVDYYGTPSYGNEWIEAAFEKRTTSFERGNADFSDYGHVGRAEAIKVGTVAMNVLMYSLREFENAIDVCEAGSLQSLRSWDKGAALYIGSLELPTFNSSSVNGKLLHHIADEYCPIFNTCGSGLSLVNHYMLSFFDLGHKYLTKFECDDVKKVKENIADMMYVPLIQGTLNAAYQIEFFKGYQRYQLQGAAFAAAVLPRVHAVNQHAAKIIYNNMRVGASVTSHKAVKEAFQSVYKEMNINCHHVGGMWDESLGIYYKDGAPCLQSESTIFALVLTGVVLSIVFGLAGTFFYRRSRSNVIDVDLPYMS